jgi:hypothetical protein
MPQARLDVPRDRDESELTQARGVIAQGTCLRNRIALAAWRTANVALLMFAARWRAEKQTINRRRYIRVAGGAVMIRVRKGGPRILDARRISQSLRSIICRSGVRPGWSTLRQSCTRENCPCPAINWRPRVRITRCARCESVFAASLVYASRPPLLVCNVNRVGRRPTKNQRCTDFADSARRGECVN